MPAAVYVDRIQGADELMARLSGHKVEANRVLVNILRNLSTFIKGDAMRNLNAGGHIKTRQTLQSIQAAVDQVQMIARIGTNNITGLFLEKGTIEHPISAKTAPALMLPIASHAGSFSLSAGSPFSRESHLGRGSHYRLTGSLKAGKGAVGAQVAFFKSVHHPGQKATPFLYPAYLSSTPIREALLLAAGQEITAFLARA